MKPHLLVLELWGLGDLAIATPFLQAAAEKFEVTLLAQLVATELRPRFWPAVEVISFTAPWTAFRHKYRLWHWPWGELHRLRRELRSRRFDFAAAGRWDPRGHWLMQLSGARERLGYPRLGSGRFLTRSLARPAPAAHRYETWRGLGAALGLDMPARDSVFLSAAPRPAVVLVHTGAKLPLRVWPLECFREIVRRLRADGQTVQIACDPDQLDWWQQHGETPACPGTVTELLALLDRAGVFIGNDSGPGHLAAASGRPTFTLFGPQLPEWFVPLHPAAEFVPGKACPYKPCADLCRFPEPFCIRDITVEEVWPRVAAFVKRNLRPET